MGQVWQVINVDRRETSKHVWGELGAWFFYPHEQLLIHLATPCVPREVDDWLSEGSISPQNAPLFTLPIETLDAVYEELRDLHEVIYLAITCKSLLAVGKRHVLRATKEFYAPWAGCRLISLGDNTRSLDSLPANLLTNAETKEIKSTELPSLHDSEEYDRSLSNFASEKYQRVFQMEWRMHRINDAIRFCHEPYHWRLLADSNKRGSLDGSARRDAKMFAALYGDGRRATYPDGVRVLCNLSKGEFVREDGLSTPNYANLAHALLARICWSSNSEVGMVCEEDFKGQLTHGAWAGDRFCVTVLDRLSEVDGGKAWKDVTVEVDALLAHIWQNNGHKWMMYCRKTSA